MVEHYYIDTNSVSNFALFFLPLSSVCEFPLKICTAVDFQGSLLSISVSMEESFIQKLLMLYLNVHSNGVRSQLDGNNG